MRKIILAAALTLAAGYAISDSMARNGDDWVRITARPCTNLEVLGHIGKAGDNPLDYRAGVARVGGKEYAACWKPLYAQEMVYLRYADGDQGAVPFGELKPVQSI